jgi:hypothetical protein
MFRHLENLERDAKLGPAVSKDDPLKESLFQPTKKEVPWGKSQLSKHKGKEPEFNYKTGLKNKLEDQLSEEKKNNLLRNFLKFDRQAIKCKDNENVFQNF